MCRELARKVSHERHLRGMFGAWGPGNGRRRASVHPPQDRADRAMHDWRTVVAPFMKLMTELCPALHAHHEATSRALSITGARPAELMRWGARAVVPVEAPPTFDVPLPLVAPRVPGVPSSGPGGAGSDDGTPEGRRQTRAVGHSGAHREGSHRDGSHGSTRGQWAA